MFWDKTLIADNVYNVNVSSQLSFYVIWNELFSYS